MAAAKHRAIDHFVAASCSAEARAARNELEKWRCGSRHGSDERRGGDLLRLVFISSPVLSTGRVSRHAASALGSGDRRNRARFHL
jgi:hypothetical protein